MPELPASARNENSSASSKSKWRSTSPGSSLATSVISLASSGSLASGTSSRCFATACSRRCSSACTAACSSYRFWQTRLRNMPSPVQRLVFREQIVLAFGPVRIRQDAFGGADELALRLVLRADAFGALQRIDHVDRIARRNRLFWKHPLARRRTRAGV